MYLKYKCKGFGSKMNDLIGILDSGVGGISVLLKAVQLLPNENFIYYGDNKNAPYGPRPLDEIRQLSAQAVDVLLDRHVKALVIACNTMTAAYASILRSQVDIPVIGMEPALKPASLARKNGWVLALATRATLSMEKFSRLMDRFGEGVIPLEGKGLVELVEAGKANSPEAYSTLAELLSPYLNRQIDAVVLGCTHYPFLHGQIEKFFPKAQIFDGREGTVHQLKRKLIESGTLSHQDHQGSVQFESSGGAETIVMMKQLFSSDL